MLDPDHLKSGSPDVYDGDSGEAGLVLGSFNSLPLG